MWPVSITYTGTFFYCLGFNSSLIVRQAGCDCSTLQDAEDGIVEWTLINELSAGHLQLTATLAALNAAGLSFTDEAFELELGKA